MFFLSQWENFKLYFGSLFGPYDKVCTLLFVGGWRSEVLQVLGSAPTPPFPRPLPSRSHSIAHARTRSRAHSLIHSQTQRRTIYEEADTMEIMQETFLINLGVRES